MGTTPDLVSPAEEPPLITAFRALGGIITKERAAQFRAPEQPVEKSFDCCRTFEPSKKVQKSFDPTRKGTLTFPFHTIPPSEAFKQEELLTISVGGTICAAHSSVY